MILSLEILVPVCKNVSDPAASVLKQNGRVQDSISVARGWRKGCMVLCVMEQPTAFCLSWSRILTCFGWLWETKPDFPGSCCFQANCTDFLGALSAPHWLEHSHSVYNEEFTLLPQAFDGMSGSVAAIPPPREVANVVSGGRTGGIGEFGAADTEAFSRVCAEFTEREEETAGWPARRCPGTEGKPWPSRTSGLGNPGQLPLWGTAPGLPALCKDEVRTPHRAARARR